MENFDAERRRVETRADYMSYVLIHGTKIGTEAANNNVRRLQRNTYGFEALRLLRYDSAEDNCYKVLAFEETTQPQVPESQQHYQYRQWFELLSRYEMESPRPLDENLKIATLMNGLSGSPQQHWCPSNLPEHGAS